MIISIVAAIAVIVLDQFTKMKSAQCLPAIGEYRLWDGVLHFKYVENRGAAFGMMQGGKWFFLAVTVIVCCLLIYFLIKERRRMHFLMKLSMSLLLAGAIGNLIDRAMLGYVRDMIYVALINFAVFNVADMAVCIGCGLLMLDVLFFKGRKYLDADEQDSGKAEKQK